MTKNERKYINFLKEENERLKTILICFMDALGKVRKVDDIDEISLIPLMSELNKQYRAELKAEAYREFAEFIFSLFPADKNYTTISRFTIKQKLKELVGEDDG